MSVRHDSISAMFEPARQLEPREQEITDALTLAMSQPQRSPAQAKVAHIAGTLGAVITLLVAFAVFEARGFGSVAPKKKHDHAQVVTAVRRESPAVDAAALVVVLQALQRRPRPDYVAGEENPLARSSPSMHSGRIRTRTRTQRHEPPTRLRCACERRVTRPPPRLSLRHAVA